MNRSVDMEMTPGREKITTATSSASIYDNVNNTGDTLGKSPKSSDSCKHNVKDKQNETCQTTPKTANVAIGTSNVGSQVKKNYLFD